MKKIIFLCMLFLVTTVFAEEIINLPIAVVVSEPITDKIAVQKLQINFDDIPAQRSAEIFYTVYNPSKTIPLVREYIILTGSAYDSFVQGIINPLCNRRDDIIKADIESKLPVVPKP